MLWFKVSGNGQHHVVQIVEGVVAAVEQLGVDLCNRLDAACNIYLHAVVLVQALQKVEHHPPARVVLVHSDFLPDDALLLLHCFLGEIRMGHAIQQDFQRLLESVGAGKKVTGLVKAGKSIGRSTRLCIFFKGIALFAFKHLVLQIMCNSHWRVQPLPIFLKPGIHPAVPGGKERIVLSKLRLRKHKNPQPIFQRLLENGLSDSRIVSFDHHNQPSFPRRV